MDPALLLKRASASSHPQVRTFIERWGSAMPVFTGRPEPACSSCCECTSPPPAGRVTAVQVPAKTPPFLATGSAALRPPSSASWSMTIMRRRTSFAHRCQRHSARRPLCLYDEVPKGHVAARGGRLGDSYEKLAVECRNFMQAPHVCRDLIPNLTGLKKAPCFGGCLRGIREEPNIVSFREHGTLQHKPLRLQMKHVVSNEKAVLALVIGWMVLVPPIVVLARTEPPQPGRVSVRYLPPKNPAHGPIYEQLKEIRFLEKVQELLSRVRLPRTLLVKLEGCDGDDNASYDKDIIVVCYEYIYQVWKTVPDATTADGVTQVDALLGPLFETTFHEFAHAVFDMLRVPVLGREEDAADQVSAYIMLHLGKAEARRLITGAAYAYKTEAEAEKAPPGIKQFANAHGTPAQRFYNLLCIAYGSDSQLFGDMVKTGHLPKERAEDCK